MNSTEPSAELSHHIPILLRPIVDFLVEGVDALKASTPGVILDCTFGGGGHTREILNQLGTRGLATHTLIGFDRDPEAIQRAKTQFQDHIEAGRLELIHDSFGNALSYIRNRPVYGVLADLGISSDQIDSQTRGFSFRYDAPLDMRMNPQTGESVLEYLDSVSETELADALWKYGEERASRRIARKLVQARSEGILPQTSKSLADLIASCTPRSRHHARIHPATQSFQALRIIVNQELDELETLLEKILPTVHPGGRIAILSFHSLEDRMVKRAIRDRDLYELPQRKAIQAPSDEVAENSRARSAKLRLAIRVASPHKPV